jgi:predicted Zn-dependent protease
MPMIRKSFAVLALCLFLPACTTNEATGRSQFTGLMPTSQETQIGATEQQKAEQEFGLAEDQQVQAYVDSICARLAPGLERQDVTYKCQVLDSPVVNAFALPGGYINVNRGLVAYANSEAELAGVLAHEMGHVTARHISERYSQSALTQLGAAALGAALDSQAANQLLGVGANLYLTSYSRSQESEADDLGIRYLNRAGYDPMAMASFLTTLQREAALEAAEQGQDYKEMRSFLSTHPMTGDRVARAQSIAANIPNRATDTGVDRQMAAISGLVFGDSPKDGFVRGSEFIHPAMGFAFAIPANFSIQNNPEQVAGVSKSNSGASFIFDSAAKAAETDPAEYLRGWAQNQPGLANVESITVNGMRGATGQIQGAINGRPALLRLVAIEWSPSQVFRFQFAMPQATSAAEIDAFKTMSYSLRRLADSERKAIKPKRIRIVSAGAGDSVATLSRMMAYSDGLNEQRFRALNGMNAGDALVVGRKYKVVVE